MVAVAVLAAVMGFCVVPFGRQAEFLRIHRQLYDSIRDLKPSNQASVSPAVWECASDWTITAYGNICFSPEHVETAEMYRLRDELNGKLGGFIDLDTLIWIWDRLAKTGPHGKQYIERYRPQFLECFPITANGPKSGQITVPKIRAERCLR